MSQKKKILLLGSYGRKNVGDDIFLKTILEKLKDHDTTFNCWNTDNLPPEITTGESTIASSKLLHTTQILKPLLQCDTVVYGGGELWMRLEGTLTPNLSIYKMLVVNSIARILRKEVIYISAGAENLKGWARFAASLSAKLATQIHLRDSRSANILNLKRYSVTPDIAYTFKHPAISKESITKNPLSVRKIAICPTRLSMKDSKVNQKNIRELANCVKKSFPKGEYTIIVAMSDARAPENDFYSANMLCDALGSNASIYAYHSVNELFHTLSAQDIVLSYRLHVNILSHLAHTPVVGIGYKPKVQKYFTRYSLESSFCEAADIKNRLGKCIEYTLSNATEQQKKTSTVRKKAKSQYTEIFENI